MSRSPALEYSRTHCQYKILSRIVPYTFSFGQGGSEARFYLYYGLRNYIQIEWNENFEELDLPVLKDTFFHTIRGSGDKILIQIKH